MGTVIDFCARPSVGLTFADGGDELGWWFEWGLPGDTRKGDTGVLFAGGRRRCYLGLETITSGWRRVRTGALAGEWSIDSNWTLFDVPVPAAAVEEALGLTAPRDAERLTDKMGRDLVAFLRRYQRSTDDPVEAIEGIMTESRRRSRSRSPKLRADKLRRSGGVCEACGTNFRKLLQGDGSRVLTVHHRKQVSAYDEPRTTTLEDLAVVCANCHMLIHADPRRAVPVEDLARRLARNRPTR